jgi:phosphatidylserine/phosphatidylglycerophosphate/cardiolipin synthase-like enzyme
VTARRQVAERLRSRREKEEQLIVSAADALGRRAAALEEAKAAGQVLTTAIGDLEALGFSRDDLAQVLDVAVEDLADQAPAGQAKGATGRANGKSGSRSQP